MEGAVQEGAMVGFEPGARGRGLETEHTELIIVRVSRVSNRVSINQADSRDLKVASQHEIIIVPFDNCLFRHVPCPFPHCLLEFHLASLRPIFAILHASILVIDPYPIQTPLIIKHSIDYGKLCLIILVQSHVHYDPWHILLETQPHVPDEARVITP